MKIYRPQLKKILQIGFPAGIQSSLFSISNVIIQSSINSFGSTAVSGNSAAGNIEGFVYMSMNSYSQTAVNFAGQNHGAEKYDRLRKIMIICLISVFFTGFSLGILARLSGRTLLSFYIPDDSKAISYGLIRLTYICIPYFICGLMEVATGLIRGIGYSILPMIITVAGVCGMRILWISTIFQIPKYHTLQNLYLSYTISWTLTFATEIIVFLILLRKLRKKNQKF